MAVSARNDLDNIGGVIEGVNSLAAIAGRNLNIVSTTSNQRSAQGSRTNVNRAAGLYVTGAGGTLLASAGNDVNLIAAGILNTAPTVAGQSAGSSTIAAGNNLNLGTVSESASNKIVWDAKNYRSDASRTDMGTTIQTQGDLTLQAGHDLNARAASVTSDQGVLLAMAGGSVNLTAGEANNSVDEAHQHSSKGFFSTKTTTTRDTLNETTALGTTLSGDTTTVLADQDISLKGSNVVATSDVNIAAGNNINIEAASNSRAESHFVQKKKSGLLGGGIGFTIGTQKQSTDSNGESTTASASTVGSTQGNVTIEAGKNYKQTGSEVLAPQGDIDISAQKIDIVEAQNASKTETETKFSKSGVTIAITSPVISAIQAAGQMKKAASQTKDGRMKALAGATAAMEAKGAYDAVTADPAAGGGASVGVSIMFGGEKSQSKENQSSSVAQGSTVAAGHDVNIVATGAGKDSDLTIQGGNVTAGHDIKLKADDEINLLAARNTAEQHSTNKSSSGGIGVAVNYGSGGFSAGVRLSASGARGKADGKDETWSNTNVEAGEKLTMESGGDTTMKGAVASGNQVVADVGGDLNIESLQDTSKYKSKQQSIGGSVTIGYGFSASVSASKSSSNSDYASVAEQSGIKAGDEGFQVNVNGNTDLKGAVIASTDKAIKDGKNSLITATLTQSDIQNRAEASAKSSGINLDSDMLTQGKYGVAKGVIGNALNNASESGSSIGQTRSAVSQGTVVITDQDGQQQRTGQTAEQTVASLNRDTATAQTAAQNQDVQAMERTVAAERAIKEGAIKQAMLVTDAVYRSDNGPKKIILKKCEEGGDCTKNEVNIENHTLAYSADGKLYVFNHGIQNTEAEAIENATQQHSEQAALTGIYTVINPHTGNAVAEVVYAGLDKLREVTGLFGISNAAEANIDLRNLVQQYNQEAAANGGQLLQIVEADHSRGSETSSIATQAQIDRGQSDVPLGTVLFNGAEANAGRMADRVAIATGGTGQVLQSTHMNDFVGTLFGGNSQTGGQPSSFLDAHGSYTGYLPDSEINPKLELLRDRMDNMWGPGQISVPVLVPPSSTQKNQRETE